MANGCECPYYVQCIQRYIFLNSNQGDENKAKAREQNV